MKVLIAGLGSIGRRHLRNLLALGVRDVLLYRTHRSTLPDDELADFPTFTDLEAALAERPDAVIVSNPTALHLQVAIPAAEAGCHLLLEKPVSHTLDGLDALERAVAANGVRVLVGFQFRFHPALQHIAERIAQGDLGRIVSARAHWGEYLPAWHPWEDYRRSYSARADLGGGVVLTLCHPLDYLRWLVGEVTQVSAVLGQSGVLELAGVEDVAEIGLRFQNGVVGSVHLDYLQRPPEHTLTLIGERGTLHWDYHANTVRLRTPEREQTYRYPEAFDRNDMFLAEMRHFLALVHGEERSRCSLHDGRRALEIALAAHHSAEQQQTVTFSPQGRLDGSR